RVHAHDAGAELDHARFQTCDFGLVAPGLALAHHECIAPATGESHQHACADEIETHATLHARKNASSFFNEASTVRCGHSLRIRISCWPKTPSLRRLDIERLANPLDCGALVVERLGKFRRRAWIDHLPSRRELGLDLWIRDNFAKVGGDLVANR